ncbi:MAG: hypothetical protein KKG09_07410 [Verrucomicrobia bacterium]|nr:hypothetical protein [Verrucomicrobiota bacterium]MBU4290873.1 hypothetical protein [Verrucomicrobiota bacterium]MBU4429694.1 hypothetical protein [Verrucomicrobiota bacterium]MBU4497813.1 hypothetical protein [Verrucomicrobiota bacterium]MCG2680622.1 hypothetical protein [Kiritimatiellia bacterium]
MKTIIAGLLMGLIAGSVPAQNHQILFKVSRKPMESATKTNWQNRWGGSGKKVSKQMVLEIEIKNMAASNDSVTLEWYFVAKSLDRKKLWVFDSGSSLVDLIPMGVVKLTKESEDLSVRIANFPMHSFTRKEGDKVEGYIVRIIDGVKIIAIDASSQPLEEIGRNDAQLKELIDEVGSARSQWKRR